MTTKNNELENKLSSVDNEYKKIKTIYEKYIKSNGELQEKLNGTEINLINIKSKHDTLIKDIEAYKNKIVNQEELLNERIV